MALVLNVLAYGSHLAGTPCFRRRRTSEQQIGRHSPSSCSSKTHCLSHTKLAPFCARIHFHLLLSSQGTPFARYQISFNGNGKEQDG
ncbi:hypothetical protein L209DRAFT_754490 [Thermothelomyces heterothallicus CBS 203.75]